MASELPRAPRDGKRPGWMKDPQTRKDRDVLVPDTLEWSGRRPYGDQRRFEPIELRSPSGLPVRLSCWDRPKGRVIATSSCTGLETPILPFGDHAWEYLEIAEAFAEEYLGRGRQIARVDFARDIRIPNSREYLREHGRRAASSGFPVEVYLKPRQLGFTYVGVAGGDRLRVYHKELETRKKFVLCDDKHLVDVVRVELQLRKGQLDERQRKNVRALRTARPAAEPREDDVPEIRLKPSPGHGIRRRHLACMNRSQLPAAALAATQRVDRFLIEQGLDLLIPGQVGTELPDPLYGETPQDLRR